MHLHKSRNQGHFCIKKHPPRAVPAIRVPRCPDYVRNCVGRRFQTRNWRESRQPSVDHTEGNYVTWRANFSVGRTLSTGSKATRSEHAAPSIGLLCPHPPVQNLPLPLLGSKMGPCHAASMHTHLTLDFLYLCTAW